MAQATWTNTEQVLSESKPNRLKFVVGGVLILAAIIFLIANAMQLGVLFLTVGEFKAQQAELAGRDLRVGGWVVGDSIQFTQIDATHSRLEFDIVDSYANLEQRLHVVALNEPLPDLLQHEAQALVEGRLENGAFTAKPGGLLLKCPTRYEEGQPAASS